ncbi:MULTISPECIES: hypothetical protein [Sulfurimonadaceae]|nr:hypothetical protein [Sulfurimonas sp. HSL-3221]
MHALLCDRAFRTIDGMRKKSRKENEMKSGPAGDPAASEEAAA